MDTFSMADCSGAAATSITRPADTCLLSSDFDNGDDYFGDDLIYSAGDSAEGVAVGCLGVNSACASFLLHARAFAGVVLLVAVALMAL